MKILVVEDGSIDVDSIESDGGLTEGSILVYRQGSEKPFVLDVPASEGTYKKMWLELKKEINEGMKSPYTSHEGFKEWSNFEREMKQIEKKYLGEE